MASIYKRKDTKVWYVTYYTGGKRISEKVGHNKKAAQYRRNEIELQLVKGERPLLPDTSVELLLDKYKTHLETRPYAERTIKRISNFHNNLKSFFEDNGIVKIVNVTFDVIDQYLIERTKTDNIKPKTANMELGYIRAMFEYAISLGYMKVNPAAKMKRLKETKKPPRFFTEDELEAIFSNSGDHEAYYMILLHTGLRAGDTARLTWSNVDLESGFIRVLMEKTDIVVTIPISDQLRKCLLDQPMTDGKLFHNLDNDSLRRKPRRYLVKVLKEAKLDIRGVGLHTFRHTFASRLIMAGVPLIQISKWLGHKDISMTMVYSHLEPTSGRDDINKINFEKEKIATSQLRRIFKRRESIDK